MVKIFEDREWYIKELPPENPSTGYSDSWTTTIYCKHNDEIYTFNGLLYDTKEDSKYFHHYASWVYDCTFQQTRTFINLNYNESSYSSQGTSFNITNDSDTPASDLSDYNTDCYFVGDYQGGYGIRYVEG
jgi:hypothetical protein